MDKKTLEALKGSIRKWFKISYNRGRDYGAYNCDLCNLFTDDYCEECPVYLATGGKDCQSSPWAEWNDYLRINLEQDLFTGLHVIDEESQMFAIAEYKFLKSLLPK